MIDSEVIPVEKEHNEQAQPAPQVEEKPAYTPRPKWQIIAAWMGLILFVLVVAGFYISIARGGL